MDARPALMVLISQNRPIRRSREPLVRIWAPPLQVEKVGFRSTSSSSLPVQAGECPPLPPHAQSVGRFRSCCRLLRVSEQCCSVDRMGPRFQTAARRHVVPIGGPASEVSGPHRQSRLRPWNAHLPLRHHPAPAWSPVQEQEVGVAWCSCPPPWMNLVLLDDQCPSAPWYPSSPPHRSVWSCRASSGEAAAFHRGGQPLRQLILLQQVQ